MRNTSIKNQESLGLADITQYGLMSRIRNNTTKVSEGKRNIDTSNSAEVAMEDF